MDFFFQLIDTCDLVIYGDLGGFVTAGVANEIEYALRQGKPVYRIDWRTGGDKGDQGGQKHSINYRE